MRHYTGLALGVGGGYILYRTAAVLVRKYFITKLTVLDELAEIGPKSTRKSDKLRGTAVICGGSIAGLLTAKVCSDHFEDVIVIEAEEWVTTPEARSRTPHKGLIDAKRSHISQYNASHNYQPLLIAALLKWFPNMKEECQKLGGKLVPPEFPSSFSGLPIHPVVYPKDYPEMLMMRRSVFETLLRSLVMSSCKNVRCIAGTAVGLEQASGSETITGVRVRTLSGQENTVPAILAVDCTGASAAGFRWLRELATTAGNEKAVQRLDDLRQTYNPRQSYRTCNFVVPPNLIPRLLEIGYPQWDLSGFIYTIFPDPKLDHKALGISIRDNNYCEFVLGGWAINDEVSTIQDIRAYVSSLKVYKPIPDLIWKTLDLFEKYNVPLSVDNSRLGTAVYIPYNLYDKMPSNFIAIGDSAMKLNPIRAVGCTKACIEALSLNGLLNKCYSQKGGKNGDHGSDQLPKDFSKRFFKLQVSRIGSSWNSYKAEDYAYATTVPSKGDDPQKYGKSQRDFGRLALRSFFVKDNDLALTLTNVRGFLAPPTDLFSPSVLLKLLRIKLFEKSPLL